MKLPKTIQLDVSDSLAFHHAAESGEWAVTGTFSFADMEVEGVDNKQQLAFRNGWLGTTSFGRSTLVQVTSIDEAEFEQVVRDLAAHLHSVYGAPDMIVALDAARLEVTDAVGLCDHPPGTLLSIERELSEDGISERINVITEAEPESHARIWAIDPDG